MSRSTFLYVGGGGGGSITSGNGGGGIVIVRYVKATSIAGIVMLLR